MLTPFHFQRQNFQFIHPRLEAWCIIVVEVDCLLIITIYYMYNLIIITIDYNDLILVSVRIQLFFKSLYNYMLEWRKLNKQILSPSYSLALKMKSTPEFNKFWKRKKKIPHRAVQKLWKSDKKEGSYDILKFQIFSENTSWPVLMNIQMSELMMSSAHNFLFISYTEMTKISYFSYENIKLAL